MNRMDINKWTHSVIELEIYNAMKNMNTDRMPSRSECNMFTGDSSLTNAIMRNGGFKFWANKLNLKGKESDTSMGMKYENKCLCEIMNRGLSAELTSIKFPYDILVEKRVKIDVKASNGYDKKLFYFTFNLTNTIPKCDIYVFYCINERQKKTLIIPAHNLYGIKQLSVGLNSMYDKYIDKWETLNEFCSFYKQYTA